MKIKKCSVMLVLCSLILIPGLSSPTKRWTASRGGSIFASATRLGMYAVLEIRFDCTDKRKKSQRYFSQVAGYCQYETSPEQLAKRCADNNDVTELAKLDCDGDNHITLATGEGWTTREAAEKGRERKMKDTFYGSYQNHSFYSSCAASMYYTKCHW